VNLRTSGTCAPTGNHLIASSSELAAPIAPGKRDITNRGSKASESYTSTRWARPKMNYTKTSNWFIICLLYNKFEFAGIFILKLKIYTVIRGISLLSIWQLHILLSRTAQISLELHFCVELQTIKSPDTACDFVATVVAVALSVAAVLGRDTLKLLRTHPLPAHTLQLVCIHSISTTSHHTAMLDILN